MLEVIKTTTTGSNGAATGTTTDSFLVHGFLMGVRIEYAGTAPATTVVTITEVNGLKRTLLATPPTGTAASYNPQNPTQTSVAVATGSYAPFYLDGVNVKVTVTLSNALTDCAVVYLSILTV